MTVNVYFMRHDLSLEVIFMEWTFWLQIGICSWINYVIADSNKTFTVLSSGLIFIYCYQIFPNLDYHRYLPCIKAASRLGITIYPITAHVKLLTWIYLIHGWWGSIYHDLYWLKRCRAFQFIYIKYTTSLYRGKYIDKTMSATQLYVCILHEYGKRCCNICQTNRQIRNEHTQ